MRLLVEGKKQEFQFDKSACSVFETTNTACGFSQPWTVCKGRFSSALASDRTVGGEGRDIGWWARESFGCLNCQRFKECLGVLL